MMLLHIQLARPSDQVLLMVPLTVPIRYNGRLFVPAQEETEPKQPNEQQRLMNQMLAQKLDEVKAKQMREQQG